MRTPWISSVRAGLLVMAGFALLELIVRLLDATSRGWPGGFFPYLLAVLAGWVAGLHWYLPVGALVGGIAVVAADRSGRGPRLREVVVACATLAVLSFAVRGFIGPHLEHRSLVALVDMSIERQAALVSALEPNDWIYLRALARQRAAEGIETLSLMAMVHSTVAFAILSAVMLPLGLAIGLGSRRFLGPARRRAVWAMAAATTALVYGAQVGAWRLVLTAEIWPGPLIYVGFLTVPLVMLLTLAWSGVAWPGPDEPQRSLASGPVA
jgi:hypothetical protein